MASILIKGAMAQVELTTEYDEEGESFVIATCIEHSESDGRLAPPGNCSWKGQYDTFTDACSAPGPETHADTGRG